ncbi:putative multidrug resistance protein [Aureobasidium sp. EXF-12298]|nr:putative multidrug resistance protein [Aureobasidium sp. EXF-12298]
MDLRTCACSATSFGPESCSGSFDFTLLFEQAILEIAPACLFLLASLWRFRHTWKSSIKTIPSRMYILKLVVVLQLTLLVLWSTRACERTTTSTVAAVLALVIAMVLIPLSHTEHSRSVRPSTLICVYLVASMGFDAVQARTLFLTGVDIVIPATLCASIATKLIITMVEASEKRAYLRQPFCSYPPETIANTFNLGYSPVPAEYVQDIDDVPRRNDIEALSRSLVEINEFWARFIEVGLGIGLLASQIGAVAVVPIILVAVSTYCQRFNEISQDYGYRLGSLVERLIQTYCLTELRTSRGFMWLILAMNFVATWAPTITFIVYAIQATVRHTESLGIAQAFTSLALLTLVTTPASKLLTVLPQSAAAMGCFERLQTFLLLPVASDRSTSWNGMERDISSPALPEHPSDFELQTFVTKADTGQAVITVEDLTVCPSATSPAAVSHATFRIEKASVTAFLGPTGSGKTTLLRALLGELNVKSGHILGPRVAVLPFTDTVLRLDSNGNVTMSHNAPTFKVDSFLSTAEYADSALNQEKALQPKKTKARPSGPTDDERKALSTRTGDKTIYRFYFRSIGLSWFLAFVVTTIAGTFCSHFSQVWLQLWTSNGGTHLSLYLPVFVVLALLTNVFTNLNMWFSQDISLTTLFDCLAQAALISTGSAYMAITIPFVLVAIYFIQAVYLRTSRQIRFMDLEAKAPIYSHFIEVGEGVATIRAFGWQEDAKERNADLLDASQTPYYLMYCIQRWLQLVLDLLVAVMAVVVMALAVSLRSSTSAGLLGVALNNILGFNQSLGRLVREWTNLETSLAAISRVKSFSETTGSERDCDYADARLSSWPSSGNFVLSNVTASYTSDDSRLVLDDISFEILAGQRIGICGRTGSGKSSLLLTFLRLLELSSGSITIDGLDIANIPLQRLRSSITTVAQDPLLLPISIRKNLDLHGTATDESIIVALRKVCLWDMISERGGLDAILLKDSVSQGQLQLIALARALLQTTMILLLDEATSNLDSATDQIMQKVIQDEFRSCTVIAIAHRLETISAFDKIAVLDQGRLVAFDSPASILRRDDCDALLVD